MLKTDNYHRQIKKNDLPGKFQRYNFSRIYFTRIEKMNKNTIKITTLSLNYLTSAEIHLCVFAKICVRRVNVYFF